VYLCIEGKTHGATINFCVIVEKIEFDNKSDIIKTGNSIIDRIEYTVLKQISWPEYSSTIIWKNIPISDLVAK